jgi:hypothetical protein
MSPVAAAYAGNALKLRLIPLGCDSAQAFIRLLQIGHGAEDEIKAALEGRMRRQAFARGYHIVRVRGLKFRTETPD